MRSLSVIIGLLAIPAYFLYPPLSGILILLALASFLVSRKLKKLERKRPIGEIVETPEGPRVYVNGSLREFIPIGEVRVGEKVKIVEIKGSKLVVKPIIKFQGEKD